MISVLFAGDYNLRHINKFIADLCDVSGLDYHTLRVENFTPNDYRQKCQILVLNKSEPDFNLQKALDALITDGIIIVNSDEKKYAGLKLSKPARIITYGYNPKSTITTSSITVLDNISVQCCIQRQFSTLSGVIIEPQEFLVSTNHMELSESDILAAVTVTLLCGAAVENLNGYKS